MRPTLLSFWATGCCTIHEVRPSFTELVTDAINVNLWLLEEYIYCCRREALKDMLEDKTVFDLPKTGVLCFLKCDASSGNTIYLTWYCSGFQTLQPSYTTVDLGLFIQGSGYFTRSALHPVSLNRYWQTASWTPTHHTHTPQKWNQQVLITTSGLWTSVINIYDIFGIFHSCHMERRHRILQVSKKTFLLCISVCKKKTKIVCVCLMVMLAFMEMSLGKAGLTISVN